MVVCMYLPNTIAASWEKNALINHFLGNVAGKKIFDIVRFFFNSKAEYIDIFDNFF